VFWLIIRRGKVCRRRYGVCVSASDQYNAGNFVKIGREILKKLPARTEDQKQNYLYNGFVFSYIVKNSILFMCLTPEAFPRRIAFAFLADVATRFCTTYGVGESNIRVEQESLETFADFKSVLKRQMVHYGNEQNDSLSKVRRDIDEVREQVVRNVDSLLERGEKLELLVSKTGDMTQEAFAFKKESTKLKSSLRWKNILIVSVILFVVFVIFCIAAGLVCWKTQCGPVVAAGIKTIAPPLLKGIQDFLSQVERYLQPLFKKL